MADITIKLNSDLHPYYVDQYGTPARPGQTVQWKSDKGKFSITIRDAVQFFSAKTNAILSNIEKISIDSAATALSETYTIKSSLDTDAVKEYEVYCNSQDEQVDAPPRIIITPITWLNNF